MLRRTTARTRSALGAVTRRDSGHSLLRRPKQQLGAVASAQGLTVVKFLALGLTALGLAAGTVGCSPNSGASTPATSLLTACVLQGSPHPAECGRIPVPQERTQTGHAVTGSPSMLLHVVRIPARGSKPKKDPLFLLAGGPGQGASEAFGPLIPALSDVLRDRDLVLVDQRGTGKSGPLNCETPTDLPSMFRDATMAEMAAACKDGKPETPAHYSTVAAADDIEAIRVALGYETVNLLGVSYGTRLAMTYAQRHPQTTRSLVLDGVAPAELHIPQSFARDAQTALNKILKACAAEPGCNAAFPNLMGTFEKTLGRLEKNPQKVNMRHPRTGKEVALEISRDVFAGGVRSFMYAPELIALLPLSLQHAGDGDFTMFVTQAAMMSESAAKGGSSGLTMTILCNEDLKQVDAAVLRMESKGTFIGESIFDEMQTACANWPRAPFPALSTAWQNQAPTLALSGEYDPVTPPRWAEQALTHLPNHQHIVMKGAAHSIMNRGCVPRLIAEYLNAPGAPLDAACVNKFKPPAFFVDRSGPDMKANPTGNDPVQP